MGRGRGREGERGREREMLLIVTYNSFMLVKLSCQEAEKSTRR